MEKEYLTDREVAQILGCSRNSIRGWVKNGILPPPVKIGHLARWNLGTLREWMTAMENATMEVSND